MKVPCPLPLKDPWSPVGYQVVEVEETHKLLELEENKTPGAKRNSESGQPGSNKVTPEPTRYPWSPVGCRVVQVAEEKTEKIPKAIPARPQTSVRLPDGKPNYSKRKYGPPLPAIFLAAGGFFLMLVMVGMSAVSLMSSPNRPMAVSFDDVPADLVNLADHRKVILPNYAANLPVREKSKPKPGDDLACKNDCPFGEKQSFGTLVQFVRNPQEAEQEAKKLGKLTFLLHVSGDFEESRFT